MSAAGVRSLAFGAYHWKPINYAKRQSTYFADNGPSGLERSGSPTLPLPAEPEGEL